MWIESDRIAALHKYEILDCATGADFADFVQIASDICEAPIAAINLIDSDRHWTLTGVGYGDRQLPINHSICAQAIQQADVFVVHDLLSDTRFQDNPLVRGGPKLRFYAGALLESPEGFPIGTVCVLDHQPRPGGLSDRQRFTLQALARQVMTQLELRRAMMDIGRGDAARQRLQASLREKEALLKEVHHRVKNNLQLVSSLLNLQGTRTTNPAVAASLANSRSRVRAMALVHENLYLQGSFAAVPMSNYIRNLGTQLHRAYGEPHIEMLARSEDISFDLDRAITCGLIANELVTNAFEHAFPNGRPGHISLVLQRAGSDEFDLTISDDGIGMQQRNDFAVSNTLGLQLVRDLVEQLNGNITVERTKGTVCVVRFPATDAMSTS